MTKEESEHWIDFYDWIGEEDPNWSPRKVKELLKDLIESKIIYQWDEAVLYSFLLRKKVINLGGNRHSDFLNNLARACKTSGGLKAIEDYAYNDSDVPPELGNYSDEVDEDDTEAKEIGSASSTELASLVQNEDILDSDIITPVEQILSTSEVIDSFSVDEEAIQFYVTYLVNQIWKNVFREEGESSTKTVDELMNSKKTGNKYRDLVVGNFLKDYNGAKNLTIPKNYIFSFNGKVVEPFLMQRYVAFKIKESPYYGNFSGTGAGKTLSAILASRVIDSKVTLIISPNDVVSHWEKNAKQIFSDSKVVTGKGVFEAKRDENSYQYWALNYDKLNQESSVNDVTELGKQKIDFIVLDEIHFSKVTQDETKSKRRQVLEFLLTLARKKNPEVKILGLSATPVVNNIREGKSLLELMSGKIYDDISTKATVPNAVTLYEKITTNSIRQKPNYKIARQDHFVEVEAERPTGTSLGELNSRPLAIEQVLTDARIPEIVKRINGPTIIYTEYVGSSIPKKPTILQKISSAVDEAGYSYGFYTGEDDTGLERFLGKKIQVLIASRPISTGVDGLQSVCTNLIFNTLPWTHALYQQILGRIVRTGQAKNRVDIHHIKASVGGYQYDENKMNRLKFKRTLADCAVDGLLPEKNLVSPQQATREAVKWLERLERGEISCVSRRELNRILEPVEIKKRQAKYGDFTNQNQKINTENSQTTHQRMLKNAEEWHEYHRSYREERESWSVIPYEEWIKRIKKLSDRTLIGDFGCGEALISKEIGGRVTNIDHVAIDSNVISCDMSNVSEHIKKGGIDVALFSLSLMGKNWEDYIVEASRCLKSNGYLFISETTKSLENRLSNLRQVVNDNGFEIYKDEKIGPFTFIEARRKDEDE